LGGSEALHRPAAGTPSWTGAVALLALAGIAAVVATSGIARRAVGALLAAAGVAVLAGSAPGFGAAPLGTAALVAGGLLLIATGGFVVVGEPRLARFGARYARSGAVPADPDRAAWDALDEGRDPTDPAAR
ncbi:MAG: Trp biosynthesis-associated membrane protein, partial [Pseudonocardia sp.]|nr:Trp biosynthesis-associated membrane protein [Pseudonocardia sp.]